MLDAVGVSRPSDLFTSIPERLRLGRPLNLPPAASEIELRREFAGFARRNATTAGHAWFLGGGAYNHDIPAAVPQLLLRSEFYTSYTPYQPEISQGTLQAIFEFQSLICLLTEMDVSNASLYDGASALAEAVLMAHRIARKPRIVVSGAVHPHYVKAVRTYTKNLDVEIVTLPLGAEGRTEPSAAAAALGDRSSAFVVQSPSFLGCIEDTAALAAEAKRAGALTIAVVAEPVSLGMLRGPGGVGADIVVGEGQSFGVPLSLGGPYVGFIASKEALVRQLPGRIVGEARDAQGRTGYVLTLATREQHIRREKATSNICTNQGLLALAATIHLSLLGRDGLHRLALQNHHKASYAAGRISAVRGCRLVYSAPFFNEFVVDLPADPAEIGRALLRRGIVGGLPLGKFHPGATPSLDRAMLFCVTEMNAREEIDRLAEALEGAL
jgi:glycine dehydrogenase subunit 1